MKVAIIENGKVASLMDFPALGCYANIDMVEDTGAKIGDDYIDGKFVTPSVVVTTAPLVSKAAGVSMIAGGIFSTTAGL